MAKQLVAGQQQEAGQFVVEKEYPQSVVGQLVAEHQLVPEHHQVAEQLAMGQELAAKQLLVAEQLASL